MDRAMHRILRGGELREEDPRPRPRPVFSGSKAGGGGIKVTTCEVPPDQPRTQGRYPFRIEGTAPTGLVLSDVATMLEARFQGDPKFNLRHSQDEAVQRLKARMEERLSKLRAAEDRAEEHAADLESKRLEYERMKDALRDLTDKRDRLAREIREQEQAEGMRQEIAELRSELDGEKQSAADRKAAMEAGQDRVLKAMGTDALDQPFLSAEQAGEMAEDLIELWRSSLQDYEAMPMLSEFQDLTAMLAKLLSKTVAKTNDRWREALAPAAQQADPVPALDRGKVTSSDA